MFISKKHASNIGMIYFKRNSNSYDSYLMVDVSCLSGTEKILKVNIMIKFNYLFYKHLRSSN